MDRYLLLFLVELEPPHCVHVHREFVRLQVPANDAQEAKERFERALQRLIDETEEAA